jgi:hypothetical protein
MGGLNTQTKPAIKPEEADPFEAGRAAEGDYSKFTGMSTQGIVDPEVALKKISSGFGKIADKIKFGRDVSAPEIKKPVSSYDAIDAGLGK